MHVATRDQYESDQLDMGGVPGSVRVRPAHARPDGQRAKRAIQHAAPPIPDTAHRGRRFAAVRRRNDTGLSGAEAKK